MLLALLALALVALVLAMPMVVRGRPPAGAPAGRQGRSRSDRPAALRPGPRAPRRAARARAAALLRERRGVGDVPRPGLHPRRWQAHPARRRPPGGGPPTRTSSTPHKPIVAYVPGSGQLLSEYCVEFPDMTGSGGRHRLPASDDVLAKWMALTSDEDRVIGRANMHLVGRQLDPARVRRDLWRLAEWERRRQRRRESPRAAREQRPPRVAAGSCSTARTAPRRAPT